VLRRIPSYTEIFISYFRLESIFALYMLKIAQLEACGRLLEQIVDNSDTKAIETEFAALKMTLDFNAVIILYKLL
jgi:hypothetical protein